MTENTNPVHDERLEALSARLTDIESRIRDITDNQRSLLLDDMLYRVKETLISVRKGLGEGQDAALTRAYLALAENAVGLCGLTNSVTRDGHKKWDNGQKTSKPVLELLNDWSSLFRDASSGTLDMLGLPAEQVARIKAGDATEQDIEDVKRAAAEKFGPDAEVQVVNAAGTPAADTTYPQPDTGYGMYL
jgi:hypothetical protein